MQNLTTATKAKEIERTWHLVDVKGKVLGRIATQIAKQLIGKHKIYFTRSLDCGDFVVVINSKHVHLTGRKEEQKVYTRYSGYPGGLRSETARELRARKPNDMIRHAVYGMLPKNKLRDTMIKRLHIYPESNNPYEKRFQKGVEN